MDSLVAKAITAVCAVLLSVVFGYLPSLFTETCGVNVSNTDLRSSRRNVLMSFLLNFGGGVLLANCFCHWLPEVREGIELGIDTALPLAEIVMVSGFLFIRLLEEIIHNLIHKKHKPKETVRTWGRHCPESKEMRVTEFQRYDSQYKTDTDSDEVTSTGTIEVTEKEEEREKSAIRTFFVVSALSFHSIIEGMAIGLEDDSYGVWVNFGAVALHKFVIAFSVGTELVAAQVSKIQYFISIGVFSFAPAIGVIVGIIITEIGDVEVGSKQDFVVQVIQGIATGTILYVVFFEIFPKAKDTGGTGFQHVVAMILGFGVFIPSLLFHNGKDGGDTGNGNATRCS